ncbi:MAG: bifunctional glycosyltransferase family 2/GtrA family protein [Candidatus Nanopelagicales bacterium]
MALTDLQTRRPRAVRPASRVTPTESRFLGPAVDIVIPVHDEQRDLEPNVRRLCAHLRDGLPYSFRVTIADNASTDLTPQIATRLAEQIPEVRVVRLERKGRGRALREVWAASDAEVLAYMDVDLSTDLAAVLPLVAPLLSGHSDIAIGTRLGRGSRVVRGPKRELISRCYNMLLRTTLGAGFSDAQCGFKAIRADAAAALLPLVEDPEWFFDTELLVLAERSGMRIHEIPVDWVDDPRSTVDILDTARKDLAGIWRLVRGLGTGRIPLATLADVDSAEQASDAPRGILSQLVRFALIGLVSTLAYAVLYWVLRGPLSAQGANAVALLLTAVGNTAANRWLTFAVRGRAGRLRHQAQGLVVFMVGLAVTSGSLALLGAVDPEAAHGVELVVLTVANVVATLVRFLMYRAWVFGGQRAPATPTNATQAAPEPNPQPTDEIRPDPYPDAGGTDPLTTPITEVAR